MLKSLHHILKVKNIKIITFIDNLKSIRLLSCVTSACNMLLYSTLAISLAFKIIVISGIH